jgi:hypothetical protein
LCRQVELNVFGIRYIKIQMLIESLKPNDRYVLDTFWDFLQILGLETRQKRLL